MKRIFAGFLLLVLVVANTNIVHAKHFCQGDLAEESLLFGHALSDFGCGMEDEHSIEYSSDKNPIITHHFSETPCCKNEIAFLQSDLVVKHERIEITAPKTFHNIAFIPIVPNTFFVGTTDGIITNHHLYERYKWHQSLNLQSLFQTYLI